MFFYKQLPNSISQNNFLTEKPISHSSQNKINPNLSNTKIGSIFDIPANPSLFDPYSKRSQIINGDQLRMNDFSQNNSEINSIMEEEKQRSFIDLERMTFEDIKNFSRNDESRSHFSHNSSFTSLNPEEKKDRLRNFEEKLKNMSHSRSKQPKDGEGGNKKNF